jgi:hypothetical protein
MAELTVDNNDVIVHLSALEALGAWRREIRVPVDCLRMVHVEQRPLVGLSLLRLPGVAWPGVFALGSRRSGGQREFVAVRASQPAVVLEAQGATWDRLVISHPDAVDVAAELAALLLGRGPGNHGQCDSPGRQRPRRGTGGRNGLTLERVGVGAGA